MHLQWELWAVGGVLLAGAEIFVGGMLALPLGVAALAVSLLLGLGEAGALAPPLAVSGWKSLLLAYSALAVASLLFLRWALRRRERNPDVNDY